MNAMASRRLLALLSTVAFLVGTGAGQAQAARRITEYPLPTRPSAPYWIAAGPDGNLWFTEIDGNKVERITTGGVVTEYPVPTVGGWLQGITAGPDGNLWFTEV